MKYVGGTILLLWHNACPALAEATRRISSEPLQTEMSTTTYKRESFRRHGLFVYVYYRKTSKGMAVYSYAASTANIDSDRYSHLSEADSM